ncbi:hypothetical protein Clacol_000391 [Clathrus columnatus]|uniref:Uncharacterized protein n=1 Tax=Clathrus columnatus TaxID=1419009 RepID=A0AAV4ZYC0_9AGAM|nr:hypothetical protein Clacol_000391 [Clathrus columnatus]
MPTHSQTQAEIIQRDKRIELREAAYSDFYSRMADESRTNHVGVTTRSAAAAAIAAINGEPPKRSSRVVARISDPVYDALDDFDSPPRKKARTTTRSANNNRVSNSNNNTTRNNNVDSNSAKVPKSVTTTPSGDRLTTRSQTRSRRTAQTPLEDELDALAKGDTNGDADEAVSAGSVNDSKLRPSPVHETVNATEECVPGHVHVETNNSFTSQFKYPEKTSSPELNTPRITLGRASSTSSTLASSRQSSDDGYRKSDSRFTDAQSLDGDTNAELGDAELPATANSAITSSTGQSDESPQPCATSDNLSSRKMDNAVLNIIEDNRNEASDNQPPVSPSPQPDTSKTVTKKTERTRLPQKRSRSRSSCDDDTFENSAASVRSREPGKENGDGGTNSVESNVVIPPEVRRSGRVLKKRKLE